MRWTADVIGAEFARRDPVGNNDPADDPHSARATALLTHILEDEQASAGTPVPSSDWAITQMGFDRHPLAASGLDARNGRRLRRAILLVTAVVLLVVGVAIAIAQGRQPGPRSTTTSWHAARPLPGHLGPGRPAAGSWQLVSDVQATGWQLGTAGPAPGSITCPTASVCYLTGTGAATSSSTSVFDTLYVTSDGGLTWAVLPLPGGFSFTTRLSCPTALSCAGAGMKDGQPVFVETVDGGHRWTLTPLGSLGALLALSCSSPSTCDGLAAPPGVAAKIRQSEGVTSADESFVTTTNGGTRWTVHSFSATDRFVDLSCPAAADCVAIGFPTTDGLGDTRAAGFIDSTSDGGSQWHTSALPAGVGITYLSSLSCGSPTTCMVLAAYPYTTTATECVGTPPHAPRPPPAGSDVSVCSHGPMTMFLTEVLKSTDSGLTWHPLALPPEVPKPQLDAVTCASATGCWAAGSEAVPETVGKSFDVSSGVFLGTTNGGTSWSKVTVDVPATAPNDQGGDAYMRVGGISCPSASVCVALGAVDVGSHFVPVYRLGTVSAP